LKTLGKFILCYVTDRRALQISSARDRERALVRCIENAASAGVDWIQIREKDLSACELGKLTRAAVRTASLLAPPTRILVNDRYDVAWAAGAQGVHAGETSLPIAVLVRAVQASRRTDFLVGASCHSRQQAMDAAKEGANYLQFGPVFATPSKEKFGPPQGLEKLAEVCAAVSIPVLAVGGITLENARACQQAGAAGIAAIRLFQQGSNVTEIAAALRAAT